MQRSPNQSPRVANGHGHFPHFTMQNLGLISSFSKQMLVVIGLAAGVAACADSPTAPSPVPPAGHVAEFAQQPPPVPPRSPATLAGALGVTRFIAFGDSITYGTLSSFDGLFLFDVP